MGDIDDYVTLSHKSVTSFWTTPNDVTDNKNLALFEHYISDG